MKKISIIKTYCDLNKQGFRYTMQYMNIGQNGEAVLNDTSSLYHLLEL